MPASRPRARTPAEIAAVPRVGPAGLRHRPAAPSGPPTCRPDPLRGAALAGGRGGRAARHERALRSTALCNGRGPPLRALPAGGPASPGRRRRRAAEALRGRLRALRHRAPGDTAARGRRAVDAAVRHVDPGARPTSAAHGRAGAERLPGFTSRAHLGQRLSRLRPVPARPRRAVIRPWALQVLEISGGKIAQWLLPGPLDPERLFPQFGLPLHLEL